MAFESRPWKLTFSTIDRDRNPGSVEMFVDTTLDFVAVEAKASAMVALVGALMDAAITNYTITRAVVDDVAPQPPETSDVERKGVFRFQLADGRFTSMSVPSFRNDKVIDGTNVINTSDVAVAAFVAAVIADGGDRVGIDIDELVSAKKTHRKSSKG